MRYKIAAAALAAAGLTLAGGVAASAAVPHVSPATVSSTVLFTGPSNPGGISGATTPQAGWYTESFAALFTQVNATFTLNAQGLKTQNGAQLCVAATGQAVQIGAEWVGTDTVTGAALFDIGYTDGTLTGLTGNPCIGGGVLGGTFIPELDNIPAGSVIETQIKQDFSSHGLPVGVTFTAEDLTNGTANFNAYISDPGFYPNEAGAGLGVDDAGTLSAPALNDVADYSGATATSGGVTDGLAHWNAVQVEGSANGLAPALLAPTAITPVNGKVCVHHPAVWHPGHWVKGKWVGSGKGRHWIKGFWIAGHITPGYKTCSGGGASSFSILGGTPVL